jgi:hypothetical protein
MQAKLSSFLEEDPSPDNPVNLAGSGIGRVFLTTSQWSWLNMRSFDPNRKPF